MGVCTTTTIIIPHTRAHAHSHTHTHPHKETHINTRTSAGSVAVIIGKTSFDRIHTSPFVVLRDSSTCPGSRAISAYCTPVMSADEFMNTGVGQGRQTPPTQVLGVMGCAVVCGGGGEGGGGTITGCARALIALFGLKTYMVKHILKFNISLKSEQGYQRARARKRGVKLSEGVRKRTWFSS